VTFRDITPLLGDAAAFGRAVDDLVTRFHDVDVDRVVGVESRGFILAAPVAYRLRAGFVPVRKAGKLPWAVAREEYDLEYGRDKLEIHRDAIHPDEKILIVDDVLATGGTAAAVGKLVETLGGDIVGFGFLIEIAGLGGRARFDGRRVESLTAY
jgi:adenine phosphoribosyltransferase